MVLGTSLKSFAVIKFEFPLKKSFSEPVFISMFSLKNGLFSDLINETFLDPVQLIGGNIAPHTSDPYPVICNTITGLEVLMYILLLIKLAS